MRQDIPVLAARASNNAQANYESRFAQKVLGIQAENLNRTNSSLQSYQSFNAETGSALVDGREYRAIGGNFVSTARVQQANGAAYSFQRP